MDARYIDFSYLTKQAFMRFGESYAEIRERYKDFPLRLMECIDNDFHNQNIKVRFKAQNASVTYYFDENKMLQVASIHFYNSTDVDLFISYLERFADGYNYIKKCWQINQYFYMTVCEIPPCIYFNCYKFFNCR